MERGQSRAVTSRPVRIMRLGGFIAVALVTAPLVSSVNATASPRATTVITGVAFSGTPSQPIVSITGRGLRVPAADPAYSPSNRPLCPKVIDGNAGRDFGTDLYVLAYQSGKLVWAAGRYRPSLSELDCIGIIIVFRSATTLRFKFGAAYSQTNFGYAHIVNGNAVRVVDAGAAKEVIVHYR